MASWDKQPFESGTQFFYFTVFRDLGPTRSLRQAADICEISGFGDLPSRNNWTARIDQWDAHLQSISQRTLINEVSKDSQKRAAAYRMLLDKTISALRNVDLRDATINQIAIAMKITAEGMRLEEGLHTARVMTEAVDHEAVLARLDPRIRAGLLRALADNVGASGHPALASGIPGGMGPECEEENDR